MNRFLSVFVVLLCIGMLLALGNTVTAGLAFTEMAQIDITSASNAGQEPAGFGANPAIDNVISLAFGANGRVFTNTFARVPVSQQDPPLDPPEAVDIRMTAVMPLSNLTQLGNPDFNFLRYDNPNTPNVTEQDRVIALFGAQGLETLPRPAAPEARFTEAAVRFYSVPDGGDIDPNDPSTWDPNDLNFITGYRLKEQLLGPNAGVSVPGVGPVGPRDSLQQGLNGQPLATRPADGMDESQVDSTYTPPDPDAFSPGTVNLGEFMFLEYDDATGQLATDPFIELTYIAAGPDNIEGTLDDVPVAPTGNGTSLSLVPNHEGLYTFWRQIVLPDTTLPPTDIVVATLDQQATLDAVAQFAFGDDFANWGSGFEDDWLPQVAPGDYLAQVGTEGLPFSQQQGDAVIPEPASIVAWAMLCGIGLAATRFRRRS